MDFYVEQTIHASPEEVAKIMFDPAHEGDWIAKGAKAEVLTPGPLAVGSKVKHEAGVHGWKVAFTTEVTALEPDRRLEMQLVDHTDHGKIIYAVAPTAGGSIATIHVHDEGMTRIPHSVWARKDQAKENLTQLAHLITRGHANAGG
jgi:uncharacterized protein YndB with AHSA1/START domain